MVATPIFKLLQQDNYVDIINGVNSTEEALVLYTEAKKLFKNVSMNLTKWESNSDQFMKFVPVKDIQYNELD